MVARSSPKIHQLANYFPMLSMEKMKALADDIKARGLLEPIMFQDGKILDGRNRWVAAHWAGVEPSTIDTLPPNFKDPLDYVISKNLLGRQLTEIQVAIGAEQMATARKGRKKKGGDEATLDEMADRIGYSRSHLAKVRQIRLNRKDVYQQLCNGVYESIDAAHKAAGFGQSKSKSKPDPKPPAPELKQPEPKPPKPDSEPEPPALPEPEPQPPEPEPVVPTLDTEIVPVTPTPKKRRAGLDEIKRSYAETYAKWREEWDWDESTVATLGFNEALDLMVKLGPVTRDRVAKAVHNKLSPGYNVVIDRYGDGMGNGHIPVRVAG